MYYATIFSLKCVLVLNTLKRKDHTQRNDKYFLYALETLDSLCYYNSITSVKAAKAEPEAEAECGRYCDTKKKFEPTSFNKSVVILKLLFLY